MLCSFDKRSLLRDLGNISRIIDYNKVGFCLATSFLLRMYSLLQLMNKCNLGENLFSIVVSFEESTALVPA